MTRSSSRPFRPAERFHLRREGTRVSPAHCNTNLAAYDSTFLAVEAALNEEFDAEFAEQEPPEHGPRLLVVRHATSDNIGALPFTVDHCELQCVLGLEAPAMAREGRLYRSSVPEKASRDRFPWLLTFVIAIGHSAPGAQAPA